MNRFMKVDDLVGKTGSYFKEMKLHPSSDIHTVGKIVYSSDGILLKSLSSDNEVRLKILDDTVPEDGMYVHIYGSLRFFKDRGFNYLYNFEDEIDISHEVFVVLSISCFTDLEFEVQAKRYEKLLDKINKDL